ncbi:MAG: hypothetical protein HN348_33250 [Proteobacteria bacterium]|jgi:UDP-2,3-diacylglucosamine pyrophosphatase LpxH|nr:hypothetical protein [Pseudomonadota bacterium]
MATPFGPPPGSDRLLVVFGDIEMGAGGLGDDFPHDDFLIDVLEAYNKPPFDQVAVDIVFNGDTFDFLKTSIDHKYPRHITEDIALGKAKRVLAAHEQFCNGLGRFLDFEGAARNAYFIVGNHDLELVFAAVRQTIATQIGRPRQVHFPGFRLVVGNCHIEHGNQQDTMFAVDESQLLINYEGKPIINLPWGTVALLDVAMPLQPYLFVLDRMKPRNRVFELLPQIKALVVNEYWRYWTMDFLADAIYGDPVKQPSWTLFREVIYRLGSFNLNVLPNDDFQQAITTNDDIHVYVMGHLHQAGWFGYGDRKVLVTGCFRNEYMMAQNGDVLRTIPKVYGEVYLGGDKVLRSHLVEVQPPPEAKDLAPRSIFEVVGRVGPIPVDPELLQAAEAQAELEAKKAKDD